MYQKPKKMVMLMRARKAKVIESLSTQEDDFTLFGRLKSGHPFCFFEEILKKQLQK